MSTTLSTKELSGAVGSAVSAALSRHQIKATNGFVINPGTLAGPLLDATVDLKVAQQVADDVTKQVQAGGLAAGALATTGQLQSGVLVTHRYILCGFFPYPVPEISVDKY